MEVRVNSKTHILYYDEVNKLYIKEFKKESRLQRKIKIFLGLDKPACRNIARMSQKLLALGIATPEVIEVEDHRIVCREVLAETLLTYRRKHGEQAFSSELIDTLSTMYNAGILPMDPHLGNFLCDGERIIVIDLDTTYDSPYKFLPKQKVLYYLWCRYKDDEFCRQITSRWTHRTVLQQGMDVIYTVRSFFLRLLGKGKKEEQDFIKRMGL